MLEALTNRVPVYPLTSGGHNHLMAAYTEALREGYLWHEFGDLHLIL
jgi:S-adenosylmethionine:tRNA-ribosyltransferase-isomerase (queuine synthetase)